MSDLFWGHSEEESWGVKETVGVAFCSKTSPQLQKRLFQVCADSISDKYFWRRWQEVAALCFSHSTVIHRTVRWDEVGNLQCSLVFCISMDMKALLKVLLSVECCCVEISSKSQWCVLSGSLVPEKVKKVFVCVCTTWVHAFSWFLEHGRGLNDFWAGGEVFTEERNMSGCQKLQAYPPYSRTYTVTDQNTTVNKARQGQARQCKCIHRWSYHTQKSSIVLYGDKISIKRIKKANNERNYDINIDYQ